MILFNQIKNKLSKDKFVLAVSGGVDSISLLEMARTLLNKDSFIVAHFNHQIRKCNDEELYIKKYCKEHDIKLHIGYGKNLNGSECQARTQRWFFLECLAYKNNIKRIVTAHHKNDLIENFILQIMRGNHIKSCPMQEEKEKNGFIRCKPLLHFEKEDIINYAKKRNLVWFEDSTNNDNSYTRNLVRNKIMPLMMQDRNILKSIPRTIQSVVDL